MNWQAVANGYIQSVNNTYTYSVLEPLTYYADAGGCGPGHFASECAAATEEGQKLLNPSKLTIKSHLAFMNSHRAAPCFRDAYAADLAIANAYVAWVTNWQPMGDTGQGRAQVSNLEDINAKLQAFNSKFNGYFSDCD